MTQPEASQRLWSRCKPLGYCQGRLEVRLNQRQERLPPLQAPIPTQMVVSAASVASVLVRCYGLLLKATSEHERQQMAHPEAARDVHGLLICRTPLTALVHATPVGSGSEGLLYLPCAAVAADLEQMAQPAASQRL